MNEGVVFIVSGPSGVGKGTVLNKVFSILDNCWFSVSATTRSPRPGEADGVHYHFITEEQFREWIGNGEFLEYAQYVGNYYGTPVTPIREHVEQGCNVFLDIEVQGSEQVCRKMPEAVSIFIVPPSLEALAERLRGRQTESEEKIAERLLRAEEEIKLAPHYDYTVVNDDLDDAVAEIIRIATGERLKRRFKN
ncbi:MAG: guanylate kinase [Oscillospiraceae bacterium]|nr:guanylate kinase [Oscillospiraceae bacterium]